MSNKKKSHGMLAALFANSPSQSLSESASIGLRELFPIKGSHIVSIKQKQLGEVQRENAGIVKLSDQSFAQSASAKILIAFGLPTENTVYAYENHRSSNPYLRHFFKNVAHFPGPDAPLWRKLIGVPIGAFFISWHLVMALPNLLLNGLKLLAVFLPWLGARFCLDYARSSFSTMQKIRANEDKEGYGPRVGRFIGALFIFIFSSIFTAITTTAYFFGRAFFSPVAAFSDFWKLANAVNAKQKHAYAAKLDGDLSNQALKLLLKSLAFMSAITTALMYAMMTVVLVAVLSPFILFVAPDVLPASIAAFLESSLMSFMSLTAIAPPLFIVLGSKLASVVAVFAPTLVSALSMAMVGLSIATGVFIAALGSAISVAKEAITDALQLHELKYFLGTPHQAVQKFDLNEKAETEAEVALISSKTKKTAEAMSLLHLEKVKREENQQSLSARPKSGSPDKINTYGLGGKSSSQTNLPSIPSSPRDKLSPRTTVSPRGTGHPRTASQSGESPLKAPGSSVFQRQLGYPRPVSAPSQEAAKAAVNRIKQDESHSVEPARRY